MLWLDSVVTEASFATTISNAAGGSGSGTSLGTTGIGGVTPVPTLGTTIPTFDTNTRSRSKISGGAIGGIAGGVSVLLAIALFFLRRCLKNRKNTHQPGPPQMSQAPLTPTTPAYPSSLPTHDTSTPSPPPTSTANAHTGPSLHEALGNLFGQQQGAQTPPLQTHWDTDDVSSNPTQPSQQGSASNLRNWNHHGGQV